MLIITAIDLDANDGGKAMEKKIDRQKVSSVGD